MNSRLTNYVVAGAILTAGLLASYTALYRPGYLNSYYLGGVIFLQVLLAAVWKYEQRFFPLMVVVFLWAGMSVPLSGLWTSGRWVVLAVGAIAGFALYMRGARHRFSSFHLVAMFCVLAALVSAAVSSFPMISFLKAVSLLLLFLYGSTGARLALAGQEEKFFPRLLVIVEIVVYLSAFVYLVLHLPVFGNPNSLGAVMGVVAVPLLFWGVLTAEGRTRHRRMILALMVGAGLLFYSQARAGMLAAVVSCALTCVVLRRYRLLIQGIIAFGCVAILATGFTPSDSIEDMPYQRSDTSLASSIFYKGHAEQGMLGSRISPWDETVSVIQQHPWFGSGFGTSLTNAGSDTGFGEYSSISTTNHEHGNSYLAAMEGLGLLGVAPFATLVIMLALRVGGLFAWLRRTANLHQCAVPVAMVLAAGLIHAGFEDWLFAVGYYLSVFFWVLAFAFLDLLPATASAALYRPMTHFAFGTFRRQAPAIARQR